MKLLIAFLVLFAFTASAQNPYATLVYDSLVICDFGNIEETESNITQIGSSYLLKSEPQKRIKLSTTEAKDFSNKIGLKSSYGQPTAACFMPHFAAMYYKDGKGIACVEICVDCNILDASHDIKAMEHTPQKADDGSIYYINTGMSKEFRKYLKGLLLKYKFSHAPNGDSPND
jgi:hypothetical protein